MKLQTRYESERKDQQIMSLSSIHHFMLKITALLISYSTSPYCYICKELYCGTISMLLLGVTNKYCDYYTPCFNC